MVVVSGPSSLSPLKKTTRAGKQLTVQPLSTFFPCGFDAVLYDGTRFQEYFRDEIKVQNTMQLGSKAGTNLR